MIGAVILAHLVGDYLLQSHDMATKKTTSWIWAVVHGLAYTIPFLFITLNPLSLLIIAGTHVLIDHYRWAKHISYAKNLLGPRGYHFKHRWPGEDHSETYDFRYDSIDRMASRPIHRNMSVAPPDAKKVVHRRFWKDYEPQNGCPPGTPDWLSNVLLIITDNTVHILIAVLCIIIFGI